MDILTRRSWTAILAFPVRREHVAHVASVAGASAKLAGERMELDEERSALVPRIAAAAYSGGTVQALHLLPQPRRRWIVTDRPRTLSAALGAVNAVRAHGNGG